MIGSVDEASGQSFLQVVEPNGVNLGYHACAIGKRRTAARTELEKLKLDNITVMEAIDAIAKMYVKGGLGLVLGEGGWSLAWLS